MGAENSIESVATDYEYQEKLGEGGFGEVWKVKHKESGKVYALKKSKTLHLINDRDDIKREIEVLKNVGTHINVVRLIDFGNDYILLEFCDLGDLDCYMRKNFTSIRVQPFMGDMIDGLRFLHRKGLAHRDLKPGNIVLSSCPRSRPICKISDFGLSKFVNTSGQQPYSNSGSYLSTNCGTPYYMAPEVGQGEYKKECDVFSLGVIFFVLHSKQMEGSGDRAVLAPTIEGKLLRHVTDSQMKSAVERLGVEPEGFREMIILMLKKDFKERATIDAVYQLYRDNTDL